MSAASDLQATINRFASAAGFAPIGVDGAIGDKTAGALIKALNWINTDTSQGLMIQLVNDDGSFNISQISTSAPGLTVYLGENASGLPPAAVAISTKPKVPGQVLSPTSILTNQNAAAGLFGLGLPDWAVYGGGAALLLGFGYLVFKKMRASSQA